MIGGTERFLEARSAVPADRQKSIGEAEALFVTNARQPFAKGNRDHGCPYSLCLRIQLLQSRRRASSKARTANLRRDSARRSYRSIASNFFASPDRIVASLSGPCGVEVANSRVSIDISGGLGRRRARRSFTFIRMFA